MSELEELKARAKERVRRNRSQYAGDSTYPQRDAEEAEADLDRAIAGWWNTMENLVNYKEALHMADEEHERLTSQLDQARADVLKMRDVIEFAAGLFVHKPDDRGELRTALTDTEHYEQYRTISPPGSGLDGLLADVERAGE